MKSFIKTVIAVMVALFATGVLSFFLVTCSMVALISAADTSEVGKQTQPGNILYLKINGPVNEIPASIGQVG